MHFFIFTGLILEGLRKEGGGVNLDPSVVFPKVFFSERQGEALVFCDFKFYY